MAARDDCRGFVPKRSATFSRRRTAFDLDDQTWLAEVMGSARAVWGREGPAHGVIYDVSDVSNLRVHNVHTVAFSDQAVGCLQKAFELVTPGYLSRSFRSLLTHTSGRTLSSPELLPFLDGMTAFGVRDFLGLNGLDPQGLGVIFGFWVPDRFEPPPREAALYRRMAHHLGAAHRCRRRLRASNDPGSPVDPAAGAEAILDARERVVHAEGAAKEKDAQRALREMSRARDLARMKTADPHEGLRRWHPLTSARWTLVDSFQHGGARYVVARENQSRVAGLAALSDRESQVVVYLALGQSTKETAYALGISDVTVRVLIRRAALKLGARSRVALLEHPEVRPLRPGASAAAGPTRARGSFAEGDDGISS